MRIIFVHGFRSKKSGEIHPDLKFRLDKALELDRVGKYNAIIVSGAQTRKESISDALQAEKYLKGKTNTPLILEERPYSTSEEVRFLKEKLAGKKIDEIVVIASRPHLKRVKYLYHALWPELKSASFVASASDMGIFGPLRELFYRVCLHFDPMEKLLPAIIFKRYLRNKI